MGACLLGAGCFWFPGLLPDKAAIVDDRPIDTRASSHCRPHIQPSRPVLLGTQTAERTFQCRFARPEDFRWTLSFVEPELSNLPDLATRSYTLAEGVPSLTLSRDDLPFSPHPYEATLTATDGGTSAIWRIIVIPHPEAAFPSPEDTEG